MSDVRPHPFARIQPSKDRICVCEHHAIHHSANVVVEIGYEAEAGGPMRALVLGACAASCDCPAFEPKAGANDG